jgi:hypothetical protein
MISNEKYQLTTFFDKSAKWYDIILTFVFKSMNDERSLSLISGLNIFIKRLAKYLVNLKLLKNNLSDT